MYVREEEVIAVGGPGCWLVLSLTLLLLTVLYLVTLTRTLAACSPARRTMEPGLVWLNIVPVFHLFWKFWTANQVAESLRKEFNARGLSAGGAFGKPVGVLVPTFALITRFVFWVGMLAANYTREGEFGLLTLVATVVLGAIELIFLIVHWVQIAGFHRQLHATRSAGRDDRHAEPVVDEYERDFDDDYRPIRVRRRRPRQDEEEYETRE